MSVFIGELDLVTAYRHDYDRKYPYIPLRTPLPEDDNYFIKGTTGDKPVELPGQTLNHKNKIKYDDVVAKIKKDYPRIGEKYFSKPLNPAPVVLEQEHNLKSRYRIDYCKRAECFGRSMVDQKDCGVHLSDDVVLPDTTKEYSYRNPATIAFRGVERTKSMRPLPDRSLETNIRKIMGVGCGDSTYYMSHGLLGKAILHVKPFGTPQENPMCEKWGEPLDGGYSYRIR